MVGASRREGSIGRQVVANLVASGFDGPVYPVNAKADVVQSIPAYKSVKDIPGPVDLAVLVVPPDAVLTVAEQCGKKGIKGLVVVTAGFKEIGGEGAEREAKLCRIAARHQMRVIGPNCMGVINTETGVSLNATFAATLPEPGAVAMVSQSGALGEAILADACAAGLGVSMFASVGNRADVTAADLVEFWGGAPDVKVILLYIESFGDPQRFVEVARRVGRSKPIIAIKAGRSAQGAAAAGSHTGAVAGADVAADTMLSQAGVLRVVSFREMFALAAALLNQPVPQGRRVAVVTNAGGPGILATDALVGSGLEMAELTPSTQSRLAKALPAEAALHNPIDLIASADAARYRKALRPVVADPRVDGLLVLFVSPIMIDAVAVAEAIVEETVDKGKPVMACVMGRQRGKEALNLLTQNGIPVFRYPEDAAATLAAMVRRRELLDRRRGRRPEFKVDRAAAERALGRAEGWLAAERAEALLAAYGVPFVEGRRVSSPNDAVTAALDLGMPVVLKGESAKLVHKSEEGAVVTGLDTSEDVHAAAQDLIRRLRRKYRDLTLHVQARAKGHREVLLGMTRDPRHGPLFAAGLGGTHVEVLRDVAFRIAPMDSRDPQAMFRSLHGAPLLDAFRGEPAADIKAAGDVLLRIQQLVLDFPQIEEVEVNPFILGARGGVAVDARVHVRS